LMLTDVPSLWFRINVYRAGSSSQDAIDEP
jgi:hypothetical protein